jgi:hypothetical protein
MIFRPSRQLGILLAVGLASYSLAGCSSSTGGGPGTGGAGSGGTGSGSGGAASTGGSQGSGGKTASGGTVGSGGEQGTGGSVGSGGSSSGGASETGGSTSTGGATTGGSGGMPAGSGGAAGGGTGNGGRNGMGGRGTGGTPPGSGGAAGSSSPGTCQKGAIKPAEVVIMGESFYAIAPQYIEGRLEDNARKAGSLGASDKYRNVAVSGQNMSYIAMQEWTAATMGGASVKFVIMDGGGIDCLSGGGANCSTCSSTFKTLLGKMGTAGVQDVLYTRYPEPGSPPGSNASLKGCLDGTMPMMQSVCEASTSPRCHWVDLRPVWVNGDVLSDGLHPTQSGGNHVGDLIWSEMVKDCLAQ